MRAGKPNLQKSSARLRMAAQIDNVKTFDPAASNELAAREVIRNVYERPFQFDESRDFTSSILSGWRFLSSSILELTVREGLSFAGGASLTAADIAFSIQRSLNMGAEASIATTANLNEVIRVKAEDRFRLLVELESEISPSLLFNFLSADFSSVLDHRFSKLHDDDKNHESDLLSECSVGSGPFELKAWSPNEFIELHRNSKSSASTNVQVIFLEDVSDPEDQLERLLNRNVDVARNLTARELEALRGNDNFRVEYGPHTGIMYLGLNTLHPILGQKKVIELIKRSIDVDRIVSDILEPGFVSQPGVIPAELSSFSTKDSLMTSGEAFATLKELGLASGFSLKLLVPQMWPVWDVATLLKDDLCSIGIDIELQAVTYRELLTKYRQRTHDAVLLMWGTDYHDPHSNAQSFFFNPDNSADSDIKTIAWRNGWQDAKANALVAQAMSSNNISERQKNYYQLQSEYLRSAPVLSLGQKRQVVAMRKDISGFRLLSTGNLYDRIQIL